MKHEPASLLERAAALYDFGEALKGMPLDPAAEPEAAAAEPSPFEAEVREPEAPARPVPASGRTAAVDRPALAEAGYILPDEPVTGLAEEVRLVKRQLLRNIAARTGLPEGRRRTVLIASANAGEGKSFCALNLALSLAGEREVEALLVEGDFTKPDLFSTLGIEAGPGLVDALADPGLDPESLVVRTDIPGLSLLSAGRRANNVPELLASSRTPDLFARLVANDPRRLVIVDSPPALAASAATILASHAGEALVVVRADRTTEADLRDAVRLLSACTDVSLVLNGAAFAAGGRRYGDYREEPDAH